MPLTPNATPVKSALRVLELLEFFAEWRRPASVKEIAQSLGYPQSSTSVLLKSLKESGYFDHDPRTGMYAPNVRLSLATAWVEEQLYSEQSLLRMMERVLAETGHTVMVGTRQGVHVRYLHVLQATRAGSFQSKSGLLRPLFRSATGKMLLTTLPEREVVRLLRQANAQESDPALRVDIDQALADRRRALVEGHAISWGTSVVGAAAMAVLLPGKEPVTLSLGGPIEEIRRERETLLQVLQRAIEPFRAVTTAR
ncbi:IclR family transcriptional regulator [Hydrogenophaga flava]|uniref:IclR family transcriptional regulator n=1 Tax=Hydrogenophaga flava TaxID=65657 RepID=UPI0008258ABE|nr:helix-turn-helix domain-containing protein [Hydrogenophaga flava]